MTRRPRVLYLTHLPPSPAISGERVRNLNLIQQLVLRGWDVDLASLCARGADAKAHTIPGLATQNLVGTVPGKYHRTAWLAARTVLRQSYEPRWFWSAQGQQAIDRLYRSVRPDVVVFGQLFMAGFVDFDRWRVPLVFESHNFEGSRLRAAAKGDGSPILRLVNALQVGPTKAYEERVALRSSATTAVSVADAEAFTAAGARRVELIPNGTALPGPSGRERQGMLFLGSFTYGANRDAFGFLCRDVLPYFRHNTELAVVGSGPRPKSIPTRVGRVTVRWVGQVDDVCPHFETAKVLVAPLRYGGGTKLKVIEAMARGAVVVTTTVGAEGLGVRSGEELVVAENGSELAAAAESILSNEALRLRLQRAALAYVTREHGWAQIGARFERLLRELAT